MLVATVHVCAFRGIYTCTYVRMLHTDRKTDIHSRSPARARVAAPGRTRTTYSVFLAPIPPSAFVGGLSPRLMRWQSMGAGWWVRVDEEGRQVWKREGGSGTAAAAAAAAAAVSVRTPSTYVRTYVRTYFCPLSYSCVVVLEAEVEEEGDIAVVVVAALT